MRLPQTLQGQCPLTFYCRTFEAFSLSFGKESDTADVFESVRELTVASTLTIGACGSIRSMFHSSFRIPALCIFLHPKPAVCRLEWLVDLFAKGGVRAHGYWVTYKSMAFHRHQQRILCGFRDLSVGVRLSMALSTSSSVPRTLRV
jgi:hypothetical protein